MVNRVLLQFMQHQQFLRQIADGTPVPEVARYSQPAASTSAR